MRISFFVDGKPQGKARPRFSRGHAYTPETTVRYETLVRVAARQALARVPGVWQKDVPMSLSVDAIFAVPKSWSQARKEAAVAGLYSPGKPDADNIAKVVMDALNSEVYCDDKQIKQLSVSKRYSPDCNCIYVEVVSDD